MPRQKSRSLISACPNRIRIWRRFSAKARLRMMKSRLGMILFSNSSRTLAVLSHRCRCGNCGVEATKHKVIVPRDTPMLLWPSLHHHVSYNRIKECASIRLLGLNIQQGHVIWEAIVKSDCVSQRWNSVLKSSPSTARYVRV